MAPEMINSNKYNGHSFQYDYWAIGIMTYIMLTGQHPFGYEKYKNNQEYF